MGIKIEEGINRDNSLILCKWSNGQGKEFQEQWMGTTVSYPLSYDKIIQKVRIEKDNVHIGRFVLNPRKTGSGLGTEALKSFIELIFEDTDIRSISLVVFDFNKNAKRVYEKLGFELDEVIESPKLKYIMKKRR